MQNRRIFQYFAFSLLSFAGVQPAWTEQLISVPNGTYDLSEIVKATGTAAQWVRYKPQTPGGVTFRGGGYLRNEYVILDGFYFDGREHPSAPDKTVALSVDASNTKIENSELFGWHDIHTNYAIDGSRICSESANFPSAGGVLGVEEDRQNVVFTNVLVHGGYGAASFKKNSAVIVRDSLFRNSFNGIGLSEVKSFEMTGSVMWVHPNHMLTVSNLTGAIIRLENNLFMDGQDMFQAGENWGGADEAFIVHNTYWIPENKPCYGFTGINIYRIRNRAVVKDNIIITRNNSRWLNARDGLIPNLTSDYNLYYLYPFYTRSGPPEQFDLMDREPKAVPYATWNSVTGQDSHSLIQQNAIFVNAPTYASPMPEPGTDANEWGFKIPASVTEARSWFKLANGSPGKNKASDGKDIGIVVDGSYPLPPLPPPLPPSGDGSGGGSGGLPKPTLVLPAHLPVNATLSAGYPAKYSNIIFRWSITPASTSRRSSSHSEPGTSSPQRAQSATFTTGAVAPLASYSLEPGYYSVSVYVIDGDNRISPAAKGYVTLVSADFSAVHVFPNPWRADRHAGKNVALAGLPLGSAVKIFTVSGHHVKTLAPVLTTATWDLTNGNGDKVASGIYVYVVTVGESSGYDSGGTATGQITVIR